MSVPDLPGGESTDQLAEKVRPWIASPYPGDFMGAGEAAKALEELKARAARLAETEKERDELRIIESGDHPAIHSRGQLWAHVRAAEKERDRLKAALEQIATNGYPEDRPTRIARAALAADEEGSETTT